jgi:hypothetical protein
MSLHRRSRVVCVFLLAFAWQALADDPLSQDQPSPTVRGVTFGVSKEALVSTLQQQGMCREDTCSACPKEKNQPYCFAHGVIGSVTTRDLYSFDEHGMSEVWMTFSTGDYLLMRDAFTSKFGKPTTAETNTYKNALGAAYEFETVTWAGKTMVVVLSQYLPEVHQTGGMNGNARFITRSSFDASVAAAEARRKKALTDF